ncbi:MAG: recombinase family protein [Atopobiaceae bacterium]|nr:recombinase family protein [Atopobiaceae bacterium]
MSWQDEPRQLVFAYVRVSSADQNPERQMELFAGLPESHVYVDRMSGAKRSRPQLDMLLNNVLREGDTLVVKSPDRLARNARDLIEIAEDLSGRGISLEFVDTPEMNVNSAQGKFMLTVMGAFAEFERSMIRERQAEGIAIAKAKGTYKRDSSLTQEQPVVPAHALYRVRGAVPAGLGVGDGPLHEPADRLAHLSLVLPLHDSHLRRPGVAPAKSLPQRGSSHTSGEKPRMPACLEG